MEDKTLFKKIGRALHDGLATCSRECALPESLSENFPLTVSSLSPDNAKVCGCTEREICKCLKFKYHPTHIWSYVLYTFSLWDTQLSVVERMKLNKRFRCFLFISNVFVKCFKYFCYCKGFRLHLPVLWDFFCFCAQELPLKRLKVLYGMLGIGSG